MNKEEIFFKCEGSALELPGFIAFAPEWLNAPGGRLDAPPPFQPLGRRSGRTLRCPVFRPGIDQYISGHFRLWKNPLPDVRLTGYK
jgi:hypothetical protein